MTPKILKYIIDQLNGNDIQTLSDIEWRDVILVARSSGVLARLFYCLTDKNLLETLPPQISRHFKAAMRHETLFHNQVRNEIENIRRGILEGAMYNILLLKGAGYVFSDSCAARGRIFSDIDILVRKEDLTDFEQKLNLLGWVSETDNYDDMYYRKWAHEIPPLVHINRKSVVDVHHNIVPIVSRRAPSPSILWSEVERVDEGVGALSTSAMFVHSAIHLFFKEEFHFGFRDLTDLMFLFKELTGSENEIERVKTVARKLGFELEVFLALRYLKKILNVEGVDEALKHFSNIKPHKLKLIFYDWMYSRVLVPQHKLTKKRFTSLALTFAFLRGHFLKMPLFILVKHIVVKSLNTMFKKVSGNNIELVKRHK
jgi:hypothetical protein